MVSRAGSRGGFRGFEPPFQYAFKLHSLMSNYNTLVVTCVQLIANEVWFCQLYFTVSHTHDMGVAKGVVIGVASRTPTIQYSWIRPWYHFVPRSKILLSGGSPWT